MCIRDSVVTVHDGARDLIYLNGILAAEKDVLGNLNTTTHPLGVGYDPIGGSLFFKGSLDEVMIFDGALDAQQVACLLYTSPSPRDRTRSRSPRDRTRSRMPSSA